MELMHHQVESGTVSGLHGWLQACQRVRHGPSEQVRGLSGVRDRRGRRLEDARRQARPCESRLTRTQGHLAPVAVEICEDTNRREKSLKRCATCFRACKRDDLATMSHLSPRAPRETKYARRIARHGRWQSAVCLSNVARARRELEP